jgi:nitrate reductase NapE component
MVDHLRSDRGRDPLAELARLIAEDDLYAKSASGDQVNERDSNVDERCTPSPPSAPTYSHAAQERGYEKESAGKRYVSGPAVRFDGFREEPTPNEPDEAARLPLGHHLSIAAAFETAPERSYEIADERGYHDKASVADDKAADEDHADVQSARRRKGLVLVMAIFGLAVVGTAGAFGYRAIFGGPVPLTLPLISKANKIAPVSNVLENATNTNEAGATITGSTENPVPREEQSVKPRVIRTIPIMSGQGWLPGAASPATATPPDAVQMGAEPRDAGPRDVVWPPPPAMAAPTAPTAAAPIQAPPPQAVSEPKKIRKATNRADQSGAADARPEPPPAAPAPIALGNANSAAPAAPSVSGGGYAVQVTSERSESNAQAALQALQAKYPNQLSGRQPIIRRADLGAKGIYYRVLVGTFASAEEAAGLCSKLKAAGGNCIVQRN